MKNLINKLSLLEKILISSLIWMIVFLGLSSYSYQKMIANDNFSLENMLDQLGFHGWLDRGLGNTSFHFTFTDKSSNSSGPDEEKTFTKDSWTFPLTQRELRLKTTSGNIQIEEAKDEQLLISAKGNLNKEKAPRLLDIKSDNQVYEIHQADHDSVDNLEIRIQIPRSFHGVVRISTVSGDLSVKNTSFEKLLFESVSGDFETEGMTASQFEGKTVSGTFQSESDAIEKIKISSISGDIKIHRKNDLADTSIKLTSLSGDIENDFINQPNGKKSMIIKTTSGDIELRKIIE